MRIEHYLAASAARSPDAIALVAREERLTYAQLHEMTLRLASGLYACGIRPGDRVLLLLENGIEAVCSFFALWNIGAVPCPLHPTIKAGRLADIIASTQPSALIASIKQQAIIDEARATAAVRPAIILAEIPPADKEQAAAGVIDLAALLRQSDPAPLPGETERDPLALIIHTSGSTGAPKGVMLTHANVNFACSSIVTYLENTEQDAILSVLPLSFGYGITQMVTMVMVGAKLVLEKSFAYPRVILQRMAAERITGLPLVPAMASLITGVGDLSLPHLRYITSAAAAMPPATTAAIRSLLPKTRIFLMYGQTECIRTCYLDPAQVEARPLSVGKPLPGTLARILDENGTPVGPGEVGELVVSGPHVMAGYWQQPEATAKVLRDGPGGPRYHSGDLFYADAEGFLYFVSRQDDIIKTRGEKVSPQEVERVLYAHPMVLEAAVEGVADAVFGEVVKAHIVLKPRSEVNQRQILRHCADHLEDYMVPKLIEFHEALPKTTSGKIRLSLLAERKPTKEKVA